MVITFTFFSIHFFITKLDVFHKNPPIVQKIPSFLYIVWLGASIYIKRYLEVLPKTSTVSVAQLTTPGQVSYKLYLLKRKKEMCYLIPSPKKSWKPY